jgi:hypothetical protein
MFQLIAEVKVSLDMRERRKSGENFTEIARVGSNTTSKRIEAG